MGKQYNYLIDTGLGSESIVPIKEHLQQDSKPVIVINTHFHWDHIWGNHCFSDSIIIAHERCRDLMIENWDEMLERNKGFIRGDVKKVLPNLTIKDSIYFPEDDIYIFYAPGHTIDGICVFDGQDKVLNVGDNIGDTVDELLPELDMDVESYRKSILRYKELDVQACVSGHNQILGREIFDKIEKLIR